jgi:diguanylate cyclase (GGDEF)-like protein
MAEGLTPKDAPPKKGEAPASNGSRKPMSGKDGGVLIESPLDTDASLRYGVPLIDDAPDSTSNVNPTDRLRAVYLLTNEFAEEEAKTALTDPPHGRTSSSAAQRFETQPIDRPILLRLDGVAAGEVVSLRLLPATIGRHPGCAIFVDDAGVSRNHATISVQDGELYIEDLSSRNGTFIEGTRITKAQLTEGCLLQIGLHVGFRYTVVDERQEAILRQLYRSSTRDALTGVFNRRHFDDRLSAEFAYAKRHETDLSLVLVDIDFFKKVNDTYGHAAGDAVLRLVASTLQSQLRVEDILCRIGGEEFAVVLRGIALAGAARLGERLRCAVEKAPVCYEGTNINVTISVGVSTLAGMTAPNESSLFTSADGRLYSAKHAGRNRVVEHDEF